MIIKRYYMRIPGYAIPFKDNLIVDDWIIELLFFADLKQKDQPALYVIEKVLRPREYDVKRRLDVSVDKRAFNIQGSILK